LGAQFSSGASEVFSARGRIGPRFDGGEHGGQSLADGDQAVDAGDPRRAAIGQDGLGPLAQIVVTRLTDALAQLADLGAALLDGAGLQFERLGLGLHLAKRSTSGARLMPAAQTTAPSCRSPARSPLMPALRMMKPAFSSSRSAELIDRGVRPKASAKRHACVQTAQMRPDR
jgi:hypothetical protein